MNYLVKKEITFFFHSNVGVVTFTVWFLALGLMLWVFTGDYNIPLTGYATLHPFFILAPILLLFLVPAITMRLFAEEKNRGTLEWLFTQPVKPWTIVISKFKAAWLLLILALIPTLIYVGSVYTMSIQGLDVGEVICGYFGIILLQAAFVSIGIFCSSLTKNQLVAFVLSSLINVTFYYGFNLIAALTIRGKLYNGIEQWGMLSHYESLARGVIYSNDLIYFASVTLLFLWFTLLLNLRKQ